ncbi:hypothetical protein HNP77_002357 [Treponema rectale]|uniref:Lipoprotein n=1 Tax=Treponema rectale TaxID=744512 RepID=A0A840SII3_9SPIR|nr:hypothetical protein [Treponema rectale]MBB5219968.1 hypothetical protein [Treponema rectale]
MKTTKKVAAAILALSAALAFVACDKDDEASSTTFGGSLPASKGVNNFKGSYTSGDDKLVIEDSVIKNYDKTKSGDYELTDEYKYSFQNTGDDPKEGTVYLTVGAFYSDGVRYTTVEDLLEMMKINELGNTDDMTADEKAAAELTWSLYKEPLYNQYKAISKAVEKNTYSIAGDGVITLTPVFDKVSNLLNSEFVSTGHDYTLDAGGIESIILNSDDGKNLRFTAYVFVTKTPADSSTPEQSVEKATLTATYVYNENTEELVLTFGDEFDTLKEKYSTTADGVSYNTILPYLTKTITFTRDFNVMTLTPITEVVGD